MTRDSRGNDLSQTFVPVDGAVLFVPYDPANAISSTVLGTKGDPKLPSAYDPQTAGIGLIESGGGLHFQRSGGNSTTFFQRGYALNGAPTLTCQFTIAELNDLADEISLGKADENGVHKVDDIIQDTKWCVYIKEIDKWGRERRTAGVVQLTANSPAADSNGTVTGQQWTLTFQPDDMYEGHAYYQCRYDPRTQTVTNTAPSGSNANNG